MIEKKIERKEKGDKKTEELPRPPEGIVLVRWRENLRQELHQHNTTQHEARHVKTRQDKTRQDNTRQYKTTQDKTRQDKTREDKTRQAKARKAKARQNKPSSPLLRPLCSREQDRLHLCTLSTFSYYTLHKNPYLCLISIDTFTYPVCALCAVL